jgi:sugar phosphate isomerase/epimerase
MKNKYGYTLVFFILFSSNNLFSQEIGLQLYSLRNQFNESIENTIKTISDWGISIVEGGDSYGISDENFIKLLDKYNIKTVAIGASYDNLRDNIDDIISEAQKYDVKYLMCGSIPYEGVFNIDKMNEAIKIFNNAGKILKQNGIILTYHIHGYEFSKYNSGTLFDHMVENSKHFLFEMDVFWVQHGGADPLELLNKYPDKFVMMHLKDMKKGLVGNNSGSEDVEANVTIGTGQIEIEKIVKKARQIGVKYMFIEDESSRVLTQVPLSLKFLKNIK